MLEMSVDSLLHEIRVSKEKIKKHLGEYEDGVYDISGPAYEEGKGQLTPQNHSYEWMSLMLPQLTMGSPRVHVRSRRGGAPEVRARALTHALNLWSSVTRMRDLNEKLAVDFGYRWSICLITTAPNPSERDNEDPAFWPVARRISPRHFIFDSQSFEKETWAWCGHLVITTLSALKAQAKRQKGWNMELVNKLEPMNVEQFRTEKPSVPSVSRDEVAYWEIWVPDSRGEDDPPVRDGYNGRLYTVFEGQDTEKIGAKDTWVREPRPYFGPRWGPYCFTGGYVMPDKAIPLSPLIATKSQEEYLNRIDRAIVHSVEDYKRMVLVRNGDPKLIQTIRDGKHDYVYPYNDENVKSDVVQLEIAGITQNHLVAHEHARETLDRASGITDAMRGNVTGQGTATEQALAASAGTARTSFPALKFKNFIADVLRSVAYYFDRDEDVILDLGQDAVGEFMDPMGNPYEAPILIKGSTDSPQSDFDLMDFEIEAGSMERSVEMDRQTRMAVIDQTFGMLAQLSPAGVLSRVSVYLRMKAELTGIRELNDLFDEEAATQAMGTPQTQPQAQAEPRTKSTVIQGGGSKSQQGQRMAASGAAAASKPAQQAKSALANGKAY